MRNVLRTPKVLPWLGTLVMAAWLVSFCSPAAPSTPAAGSGDAPQSPNVGAAGEITIPETPGAERPRRVIGVPETPQPDRTPSASSGGWREIPSWETPIAGSPRGIAREFIVKSATYAFDGIETSLQISKERDTWQGTEVFFRFQSGNGGYGDRTGKIVTPVVTPHEGIVVVQGSRVVAAVLDGVWDMVKEAPVAPVSGTGG